MSSPFDASPTFSIESERLQISYFLPDSPEHCDFLVKLWNTEEFIKTCGRTGVDTPEKASNFLRNRVHADYARNHYGMFLASLKPHKDASLAESTPIGSVSLMKGEPPNAYLAPDIGYAFLPTHTGKGYATEASLALLEYAKRELGVDSVFGFCGKEDTHSARVLQKIGLEFRGSKKLRVFGGKESAVYALPAMSQDLTVYGLDD
ncbi:Acyl-CoA N-acyltransferase [Penicillium paradoxum]|uniref:Acyl-CoA N-acyltransferase n=1 Tax=Penicillium paradoxum TaxID=176176 RepID=UPI0025468B85|nr:Acyl-CoA N-acyltransferase [Penicillium paradoxum]KAJ5787627.1 Acyl-CoA N-acyltransferase [Penicillium paradoxum]